MRFDRKKKLCKPQRSILFNQFYRKIKIIFLLNLKKCSSNVRDYCVKKIKFSNGLGEGLVKNRKIKWNRIF